MERREEYTELQTKILAARRVWKRSLFWTGIAIVLIGLLAILVGGSIVDWLMPLPSAVRIAFSGGNCWYDHLPALQILSCTDKSCPFTSRCCT